MAHVSIPLYSSTIPQRYGLIGFRCTNCGKISFTRTVCECGEKAVLQRIRLSGRGKIFAFTVISVGPPEFSEQQRLAGKYGVAIVEMDEGPRIVAQMTDCHPEKLTIGMNVEAVFRRIYEEEGIIRYGLKFKPKPKKGG